MGAAVSQDITSPLSAATPTPPSYAPPYSSSSKSPLTSQHLSSAHSPEDRKPSCGSALSMVTTDAPVSCNVADLSTSTSPSPSPSPSPASSSPSVLPPPLSLTSDDDSAVALPLCWTHGGNQVFVVGSWDSWVRRIPLHAYGNEHTALLYLPEGDFQFKFLVDDVWRCEPDIPTLIDAEGHENNYVSIRRSTPEFDTHVPLHASGPPSPLSSYDQQRCTDFSTDPPPLPQFLETRVLKPLPDDISPLVSASASVSARLVRHTLSSRPASPRPSAPGMNLSTSFPMLRRPFFSHIFVDHLYETRNSQDDEVLSLSQTSRFGVKVINTVFVVNSHILHSKLSDKIDVSNQDELT